MSLTALKALTQSSKANVLIAVLALITVSHFMGRITAEQWLDVLEVIIPSWMATHTIERGITRMAEAKAAAAPSIFEGEKS